MCTSGEDKKQIWTAGADPREDIYDLLVGNLPSSRSLVSIQHGEGVDARLAGGSNADNNIVMHGTIARFCLHARPKDQQQGSRVLSFAALEAPAAFEFNLKSKSSRCFLAFSSRTQHEAPVSTCLHDEDKKRAILAQDIHDGVEVSDVIRQNRKVVPQKLPPWT